jgi:type II secretory pathway pseudopilin PulG
MTNPSPISYRARSPQSRPSEEGYILLSVMFLLVVLMISLTVAAPRMARSIQRDREVETMRRGKQYIRGVQLYYRKFHAYPPTIDALVKTNDIRFVRKRYIDPMTGKDDWKPIMFGQNKAPTAMGFFGQPLSTGGSIAGIGPSGGNPVNGGAATGSIFDSSGAGSATTPPAAGSTDNSNTSTTGTAPASGATGGTDASGAPAPGSGITGQTGTGQTGQTFGGAGIIGFSPGVSKPSLLIYKKKDHLNEWEFTYDPIMEMMTVGGGNTGTIGQPAGTMPGAGGIGIPGITTPGTGDTGSPGPPASGTTNNPTSTPPTPPETPAPQ